MSIVQMEEMCKKKDISLSDKICGLSLHDTKDLFVDLTNFVMYSNYEEQMKNEKKILTCIHRTLTFMKENIKKQIEELINSSRQYIDELFGSYYILDKKGWEALSKLKLFLDMNGDQDMLLVNGRDIILYAMDVNFSKKVPLNTQELLEHFTESFKHNRNIFEQYQKEFYKIEKDIKTYLGNGGKRFPLKFTHWNNSYNNVTQNVAARVFMDDFYDYFSLLEMKLKYNPEKFTGIDISFLEETLESINNIIKSIIEYKTEKLFGLLNNIFQGYLRSILGFFTHLFDTKRKKNKVVLETIAKEKMDHVYESNFLFDVESHFMKVNFGLDINSRSLQLLKNEIENAKVEEQERQIMNIFKVIVHELMYRKQVMEFSTLVKSLKENSKTVMSYFREFWGCMSRKNYT
ncbi:hypothetical protein C922_03202 [Plasmodium inui San Antonio 1]|uniref:Uncharacterized protein n=1 Tax=Plasmodium inui San Antonio 1 TaxID=1237626 RepID=W7ALT3_9APIC|nr:hypothetical protein C922_03202 [Plasmodium inui San Antonio 1]EUD66286.1 hypothetical protein C922_03202 [Plasmodium inui San Antonio 1]